MAMIALQQDDSNNKWARFIADDVPSPMPTSRASPGLVAHWLHRAEVFDCGGEFTVESIIQFCKNRGIEPLPVLLALRGERRGEKPYSVEKVTYEIRDSSWDVMRDNQEIACCPVPRWMIGATTGRQKYSIDDCEDSIRCPDHAHRKTNAVLKAGRRDWLGLDVVYVAQVPDDAGLINRVRSTRRPGRKAARSWYVVRRDWQGWSEETAVYLFATKDLAGPRTKKPPRTWEPVLPEEAIERLAEALRLPGVVSFSPKWIERTGGGDEASSEDRDGDQPEDGDQEVLGEQWISLPSVMPENRDAAMDKASAMAKARWGFIPTADFFPGDKASVEEFVEFLKTATKVGRLQRQKKG